MSMLRHEQRIIRRQDYTNTVLWGIGRCIAGEKWPMPEYIGFMYPKKAKIDTRTAQEIIDDICARL